MEFCCCCFCFVCFNDLFSEIQRFCGSDPESAFCRPVLRKTALGDPEALTQVLSLGIPQPLQAKAFQFSVRAAAAFSSVVTFPFPFLHRVVLIRTQSGSAHFIRGGGGKRFSDNVGKTSVCISVCILPKAIVCHLHICIHVCIFSFSSFSFLFFKRQVLTK